MRAGARAPDHHVNVRDFDFDLPTELIAQDPPAERGGSRLLRLDRATGAVAHLQTAALPDQLAPGDVLVVNDTRVFPARLLGHRVPSGGAVECLLVNRIDEAHWEALVHPGQKLKPAAAADKELAALGQKLWRGGNAQNGTPACAGCHGPTGAGIPAQYPRVAGQYAEYLAAQLRAFKDGARANDPNGMMRGVAARLSEREIRAVAEYAAGLR